MLIPEVLGAALVLFVVFALALAMGKVPALRNHPFAIPFTSRTLFGRAKTKRSSELSQRDMR